MRATTAFESAVEEHQGRVFTFASYLLGCREEAEDVTQEVLLKLWRNPRTAGSNRLGGWLLKVTRNACFDRLRSRRTANRVFQATPDSRVLELVAASGPDPETRARAAELGGWLEKAVGKLAEPQRSIVILREVQGLSYREICDALDLSMDRVKVYLHRGRRRLREELKEVRANVSAA